MVAAAEGLGGAELGTAAAAAAIGPGDVVADAVEGRGGAGAGGVCAVAVGSSVAPVAGVNMVAAVAVAVADVPLLPCSCGVESPPLGLHPEGATCAACRAPYFDCDSAPNVRNMVREKNNKQGKEE